jgi:hypothetical protein
MSDVPASAAALSSVLERALPLERSDSGASLRFHGVEQLPEGIGARLRLVTWTGTGDPARIDELFEATVPLVPTTVAGDPTAIAEGYVLAWTLLIEVATPTSAAGLAPTDRSALEKAETPTAAARAVLEGLALGDFDDDAALHALRIANDTWGEPTRGIRLGRGATAAERLLAGLAEASSHFPTGCTAPRAARPALHPLAVFLVMATAGIGVADALSHFTASVTSARLMVAGPLLLQYYAARSASDIAPAAHRVSLAALGLCALWAVVGLVSLGGNGFPTASDALGVMVFLAGLGWLGVTGRPVDGTPRA